MKKFFYTLMVLAMTALTFTSCDDVPMPYDQPNTNPNTPTAGNALPYSDTNLKDWTVVTKAGTPWSLGNSYAKATGYESSSKTTTATETWLVSPKINLTTSENAAYISFDNVIRYVKNATDINNHELYISTDSTNWTKLDYKPVESATQDWTFYAASPIQIPAEFINKEVYIAFKFTCGSDNSTTWELQNFTITPGTASTTPDTPTTGEKGQSKDNPYTVAEAVQLIKDGKAPSTEVYVKGIVSSVDYYNSTYKSLSYYLSDDGKSKDLDVYSGKGLDGADFSDKTDLKVGQTVIVCGNLTLYTDKSGNQIPEINKNSKIVSIEGDGTTPTTPTSSAVSIDGTTVTLNSSATAGTETATIDFNEQGLENDAAVTTFTLSDGTKITFDANGQKNGPKFYTASKGVRVYLNNTITFEGIKNIAKIVMTCDKYKSTEYVGNAAATVTFNGKQAVYTNSDPSITSGGGVQLRVQTITIYYAK